MYLPRHFAEDDLEALWRVMADNPLATVVRYDGEGGLTANHVPLFLDPARGEHGTLVGHVARANPLWQSPGPVLAVFHGIDAYISPNWLPSKHVEGPGQGRVVPTWNYVVVHAHGDLVAVEEPAEKLRIVSRLTDIHEAEAAALTGATPWRVGDAPSDYIDKALKAIVGIEIRIERLVGKAKLSQNRTDDDRAGVAAGLAAAGKPPAVRS